MLESTKKYLKKDINELNIDDFKKIEELIDYHNDLYYNKENPIISDVEYDNLFKKLQKLEKKFNIKSKLTNQVGSNITIPGLGKESTFKKVKHSRPMISLNNTYNEEDLNDFDDRLKKIILSNKNEKIEYVLEYKFDGVGIELIYKKGKLVQAITRGNGIEGEDVTENIMQIDNIPKIINYKDHLEVRGEIIMPIGVFKKLNTEAKKIGGKIFSNPRNAASGSIRLIDNNVTKQRELKFFAYDLANFNDFIEREKIGEYYNVIKALEKIGFDISSYLKKIQGIEKVINTIDNFGNLKNELDFEVDGLVLKVNNISLWKQIGSTEHHPRYAIAYKFPAEILTTKLLSVEHSIGRTGTITPVAHLEPINIGGVIVKRATLHNYDEIENLDVRIGDTVFIKRAGEVIPKIISVVTDEKLHRGEKILAPEFCPSCGVRVLKDENKVRFYCSNKISCPVQNVEKLAWSVGKQGFNIDGLGEKQVELFLRTGIVKNLVDIFYLKNKTDQILELEGFQDKSILNLIESIEKAKNINIASFLVALGISGVGKKTAKTLSKLFLDKNNLINFNYSIEDLEELEDVGPEIANNVITYFGDEDNQKILGELINILNIKYYTSPPTPLLPKYGTGRGEGSLYGKKVCITGSFPSTGQVEGYTRDNLIKILEEKGGEFVSSVSKNTDFLLAGEKAGSKLNKANEFGVKVLNLTEFLNYI